MRIGWEERAEGWCGHYVCWRLWGAFGSRPSTPAPAPHTSVQNPENAVQPEQACSTTGRHDRTARAGVRATAKLQRGCGPQRELRHRGSHQRSAARRTRAFPPQQPPAPF
eukprot:363391-Chlamydomonas_euryale.AAC.4